MPNTKDDLILEAIQDVKSDIREVRSEVQDIKLEQIKHGLIHEANKEDLANHIKRTEVAEDRLTLLEEDAKFFKKLISFLLGAASLLAALSKIVPWIGSHL